MRVVWHPWSHADPPYCDRPRHTRLRRSRTQSSRCRRRPWRYAHPQHDPAAAVPPRSSFLAVTSRARGHRHAALARPPAPSGSRVASATSSPSSSRLP